MEDKLFSVEGQVVLVTGGSRGIGRALAEGFAARNAQVVIAGREADTIGKTAKEISTGKHAVEAQVCDVAKPEEVARLVEGTVAKHGRIDTLVSVAGVNKRMKAESYTIEEYDWIVDINLRGVFVTCQRAAQLMIEAGHGGAMVTLASMASKRPTGGVYSISKAAVWMMTRCMANELGRYGISFTIAKAGVEFLLSILKRLGYVVAAAKDEVTALIANGLGDLAGLHFDQTLVRILGLGRIFFHRTREFTALSC